MRWLSGHRHICHLLGHLGDSGGRLDGISWTTWRLIAHRWRGRKPFHGRLNRLLSWIWNRRKVLGLRRCWISSVTPTTLCLATQRSIRANTEFERLASICSLFLSAVRRTWAGSLSFWLGRHVRRWVLLFAVLRRVTSLWCFHSE